MNHDNPCGEVEDLYRDRWPTYEADAQKMSKMFGKVPSNIREASSA